MDVYVFSSVSVKHIEIACEKRQWAVSVPDSEAVATRWVTMAYNMPVGSQGVFYASDKHAFTVPFRVISEPTEETIQGVWPGVWYLPFDIRPQGKPRDMLALEDARLLPSVIEADGNVGHVLHFQPNCVFAASKITDQDWQIIWKQLVPE